MSPLVPDDALQISEMTREALRGLPPVKASLIPALQRVQAQLGYLPRAALVETASYLGIAPIEAYSVATFYNQFRLNPPGRHSVRVCLGTACHMKGGHIALEAWQRRLNILPRQTTPDGAFDLDTVDCVGCCHLAPVTVVDAKPEAKVEPTRVDGILLGFGVEIEKKDNNRR